MGKKHLQNLQKVFKNLNSTEHLQFQIVEHSFNLKFDGINMKSQGSLRKNFRYDEDLKKQVFNHLDQRVKGSVKKRIEMINDLEGMISENFDF
jgi:hypothetical protein